MALKKTLGIIGLTAFLVGVSPNYAYGPGANLEQVVNQQLQANAVNIIVAEQENQAAQVEQQKLEEMRKLFDDNDDVVRGVVEKVEVSFSPQYRKICTNYYLKDVAIYKLAKNAYIDAPAVRYNEREKGKPDFVAMPVGSRKWLTTDKDTGNKVPGSLPFVYAAVKPGTEISEKVKEDALKFGIKEPVYSDKIAAVNVGDDLLAFAQSMPGRRSMAVYFTPMSDPANVAAFSKLLTEKGITDNYVKK